MLGSLGAVAEIEVLEDFCASGLALGQASSGQGSWFR